MGSHPGREGAQEAEKGSPAVCGPAQSVISPHSLNVSVCSGEVLNNLVTRFGLVWQEFPEEICLSVTCFTKRQKQHNHTAKQP